VGRITDQFLKGNKIAQIVVIMTIASASNLPDSSVCFGTDSDKYDKCTTEINNIFKEKEMAKSRFTLAGDKLKLDYAKIKANLNSRSLPIEGIQIGMSASDISNLFPSINPSWLNDTYIDETGKKQLRGLVLFSRDVSRFSRDKIDGLYIEFDENSKVRAFVVAYDDLSLNKNADVFKEFLSQRYGLSGSWSTPKNEGNWCRELIIGDYKYIIIISESNRDYPRLRVDRNE